MFNSLLEDPKNELLRDRLARLADTISSLKLSTKEDFLAQVYSSVNQILNNGTGMTPLRNITPESTAIVGDLVDNFNRLNRDGADIAGYILRIEDLAARFYNLTASTQNALRQRIREGILGSDSSKYRQAFVSIQGITSPTSMIDVNAGLCSLPVNTDTDLTPKATIAIGSNSIGIQTAGIDQLNSPTIGDALVWTGTQLELILTFPDVQILNRLKIGMDDYQGLELVALATTPDGSLTEDVLADLGVRSVTLNGASGKFSGDCILDFPPRHCKSLRLLIQDRVGEAKIALRTLEVSSRKYDPSGIITAGPISKPVGSVMFVPTQYTWGPLTAITHQISYDGSSFLGVTPSKAFTLQSSPFWYRAVLQRSEQAFSAETSPLAVNNADPIQSPAYTLSTSTASPLGSGVTQRVLVFSAITGPIPLREIPMPGTLQVQQGSVVLGATDYAFLNNILSFAANTGGITVSYQTSSLGESAITEREPYYSPLLYEALFETV